MDHIEAKKISGRFRMMFEEVHKDLCDVLNQYKFNENATNLNDLKLKLAATMDWHKDKIYKVQRGYPIKEVKVNED